MKKFLVILFCLLHTQVANSQMTEAIGMLTLQGQLGGEEFRSIGKMQDALNKMQFQQDLAMLTSEIRITFMGNYNSIDKNLLSFNGFKNINWNVIPVSDNEYVVEFDGIDGATCFLCKGRNWNTKKVDVNNGQDCQAENNNVKMYF